MRRWTSPIRILLIYLSVLSTGAIISWTDGDIVLVGRTLLSVALLFGSYSLTHAVLLKLKWIKPTRWEHQAITALILFLLFESSTPWYGLVVIGVVAEVLQRLIRVPTGPVFNPAAITAVIATLLAWYPAWWGVSFAPRIPLFVDGVSIAVLLTLPVAGYVAYKYRKLPIILATLVVFIPLYMLALDRSPLFILFEGTLAFFLLVMAIEPKTSPAIMKQQLVYGAALGALLVAAIQLHWLEPYTMALVVVNLIFSLYKNRQFLRQRWFAQTKKIPVAAQPTPPAAL